MRTARRALIVLFACFLLGTAQAQLYLEGHGVLLGRIGSESFNVPEGDKYVRHPLNLAQGLGGGLVFGGSLNDMLGIEARVSYVGGSKIEVESGSESLTEEIESLSTFKSKYFRIEPALRLTRGAAAARVYVAAGPSIAVGINRTFENESVYTYLDASFPFEVERSEYSIDAEYTGGVAVGAFGAIGFLYQSPGGLGFFVELTGTAQSWAPKKGKSTTETHSYYVNGTSDHDEESESFTFVDEYDTDDDDKVLKEFFPMSTWGLRIGLHVQLGRGGE